MTKNRLNCLFFSDLLPWEKMAVEPLLVELAKEWEIRSFDISDSDRSFLKKSNPQETYWVIAKNWRQALKFLGLKSQSKTSVYVSVFELSSPRKSFYELLLRPFLPVLPPSVKFLTYSPLSHRFFTEMEGVSPDRVHLLPLPFSKISKPGQKENKTTISVGTFTPFVSQSNLNYFLAVAHYLVQKMPTIRFRLMGTGPLYSHVARMISDLGLRDSVEVIETSNFFDLSELDIFLYGPLRNDHFFPLLLAGAFGLPVIANELTGIENILNDGHTAFLVPVNETKPMAELVLRLTGDAVLRQAMGQRLKETLEEKFSSSSIVGAYADVFFHERKNEKALEKAA